MKKAGVRGALMIGAMVAAGCLDGSGQPIQGVGDNLNGAGAGGTAGQGGAGAAGSPPSAGQAGQAGQAGGSSGLKPASVDLLLVVDNSASMADKQNLMAQSTPDLIQRLINPRCINAAGEFLPSPATPADACPAGYQREFTPVQDLHIGVISSSLGGHGGDVCDPTRDTVTKYPDDKARLLTRGQTTPTVETYSDKNFLAWDPQGKFSPAGEPDITKVVERTQELINGASQTGCGYEAPLEAWYRFLVDPNPPLSVQTEGGKFYKTTEQGTTFASTLVQGRDETLLQQRAAFLRPDSLLLIVMLTDEDDCSFIDGTLPATVCDDPTFDQDGHPNGCNAPGVGWPAGYLEGNAQGTTQVNGRVTGTPFPFNHFGTQRIADGSSKWRLAPGTAACATDPYSPACQPSCYPGTPGCITLTDQEDDNNRRCWNQKRRFGVDFLYPIRRYVDGLSQPKVYDRDGNLVPNPIFVGGRSSESVVLTTLVGVPWQYIARDPADLSAGFRPSQGPGGLDWESILGDPFNPDSTKRHDAADPVMQAEPEARSGTLLTGTPLGGAGTWNPINGHEYNTGIKDLQYSCIFPLAQPRDCSTGTGSCDCVPITEGDTSDNNPLCEKPDANGVGDGVRSSTQYFAKAYPAPRVLQVVHDLGAQGVVGSLCASNVQQVESGGYGYRPTVSTIVNNVSSRLR